VRQPTGRAPGVPALGFIFGGKVLNGDRLGRRSVETRKGTMLYTIAVILVVLWVLGLVTSYTMGGFIHVLLVIAIVAILIQVIQGRRV
jgi:hypothetical protein